MSSRWLPSVSEWNMQVCSQVEFFVQVSGGKCLHAGCLLEPNVLCRNFSGAELNFATGDINKTEHAASHYPCFIHRWQYNCRVTYIYYIYYIYPVLSKIQHKTRVVVFHSCNCVVYTHDDHYPKLNRCWIIRGANFVPEFVVLLHSSFFSLHNTCNFEAKVSTCSEFKTLLYGTASVHCPNV